MTAAISLEAISRALGVVPLHAAGGAGNAPPGHPFFGAGFLFVGSLLVVETLAGGVWRRSQVRTMLWPAALIASGLAMLLVTYVQPTDKSLHFALALLLLIGGLIEGQYRLGQVPRSTADMVAVPALALGGFLIGPMHANGTILYSATANTHVLVGLVGFALAGMRIMQVRYGSTMALDATFGAGVMMLGLSLLLVEQFHGAH